MKQKTFKKTDTIWTVVISALALLLVAALLVGVTGKTKAEYIPAPDSAADDFSGTMLANYDNLNLYFYSDEIIFDFNDVNLLDYNYVVLDVCNVNFTPTDSYTLEFGPDIDGFDLKTEACGEIIGNECVPNVTGLFTKCTGTFTYIFDMTDVSTGVKLHLYHDGNYHTTLAVNEFSSSMLLSFTLGYDDGHEHYANSSVGGMYLYGFENARDCTIGDYIADHTLKLTDCKDSMLYKCE